MPTEIEFWEFKTVHFLEDSTLVLSKVIIHNLSMETSHSLVTETLKLKCVIFKIAATIVTPSKSFEVSTRFTPVK